MEGFAKEQPKDGQTIMVCRHVRKDIERDGSVAAGRSCWFQLNGDEGLPISFTSTRPENFGKREAFVAHWFVCCSLCYPKVAESGIDPDGHFTWKGNEPVIKDGRN